MKSLGPLWGAMGGAGLLALGWWWIEKEAVPSPRTSDSIWPLVSQYPLYTLTGAPASPKALEGKVVLLAFIYTRCPSVCPRLQSRLRETLAALPPSPDLVAVSISLDPVHDTPERLALYAQSYAVAGQRWEFWRTASQQWSVQLAEAVFGLTAAPISKEEIMHTDAIVLVDCTGRIRGIYASEDDRLLKHTQKLLRLCESI